ncbi:unnamed protein product, partial [Callosobruchus maculatus]
ASSEKLGAANVASQLRVFLIDSDSVKDFILEDISDGLAEIHSVTFPTGLVESEVEVSFVLIASVCLLMREGTYVSAFGVNNIEHIWLFVLAVTCRPVVLMARLSIEEQRRHKREKERERRRKIREDPVKREEQMRRRGRNI